MSKYRKTALVEAEQFLPPHQIPEGCYQKGNIADVAHGHGEWFLKTLEGEHPLRYGDYIPIGVAGERWNVERAIFEASHEPVDTPAPALHAPTVERETIIKIGNALTTAQARIRVLEEALQPFAEIRTECALGIASSDVEQISCGHCDDRYMLCFRYRRAREALSRTAGAVGGEEPCQKCDDSGWQEFASGGIWTGENISVRREPCDCICGDDVRREQAALSPSPAVAVDGAREITDTDLLNKLREESWDLRCFDVPTGGGDADVGWRVVGHWQAEPCERMIAEVFHDEPRDAILAALDPAVAEGSK
ncbi:MAG: hypothetical protein ABW043_16855 [Devosia sp.]|uniref:hypothetical protein n=1 Tax=Devosia sp. TaxID=1871048 RepID=UPI003395E826